MLTGIVVGATSGIVIHYLKKLEKANKFNPDDFRVDFNPFSHSSDSDLSSLDKFFGDTEKTEPEPDLGWGFEEEFDEIDTPSSDSPATEPETKVATEPISWADDEVSSDSAEFEYDDEYEATYGGTDSESFEDSDVGSDSSESEADMDLAVDSDEEVGKDYHVESSDAGDDDTSDSVSEPEGYSDDEIFLKLNKVSRAEARRAIRRITGKDATYMSDAELSQLYNEIVFEENK